MKHITDYIKTHKYCLLLLYWPVHTLWYEILRIAYSGDDVLLIHCALDDRIPFCEWFVIPYCIWYLYIAAVLLYTLIHSKRDFIRTTALMCLCMILPMLFCTFVPNGIPADMRPDFEALGRNNPAIWAVKRIYAADTPPAKLYALHARICCICDIFRRFAREMSARKARGKVDMRCPEHSYIAFHCLYKAAFRARCRGGNRHRGSGFCRRHACRTAI